MFWLKCLMNLKVVSATCLIVCFACPQEGTCEIKKNVFYFTSKALFSSGDNQILNFQMFKCHDLITCRRMKLKHILLNNLGNKRSLEMKFGQFMQHYKIKFFIKNLYKKCGLDTSSRHFLILKNPL